MIERIESNVTYPDLFDELYYIMLHNMYKNGNLIEILANPEVHIFKNIRDPYNSNKEIIVPIF